MGAVAGLRYASLEALESLRAGPRRVSTSAPAYALWLALQALGLVALDTRTVRAGRVSYEARLTGRPWVS